MLGVPHVGVSVDSAEGLEPTIIMATPVGMDSWGVLPSQAAILKGPELDLSSRFTNS